MLVVNNNDHYYVSVPILCDTSHIFLNLTIYKEPFEPFRNELIE